MAAQLATPQYGLSSIELESKGFWRWCVMLIITEFVDFAYRPEL
jgi:hypothetical protein